MDLKWLKKAGQKFFPISHTDAILSGQDGGGGQVLTEILEEKELEKLMDIDMGLSESSGKKRIRVRFYFQDLSNLSLKSYGVLYQVIYNYDENGNILEPYLNSDSKIEDADGVFIKKVLYDYNGTEILKKRLF